MMKREIELNVFDYYHIGFSEYICFKKFKVNCNNIIQQHYEIRCVPFVLRTEMIKKKYVELKFVVFNLFGAIKFGAIDG